MKTITMYQTIQEVPNEFKPLIKNILGCDSVEFYEFQAPCAPKKCYAVYENKILSNSLGYTRKYGYSVVTEDPNYGSCKKACLKIVEHMHNFKPGYLFTEGQHQRANNIADALHPYFTFKYNQEDDACEIVVIFPYDD